MRGSGILLHITSLPNPYGIGTVGKCAFEWIDFLEKAGQKYWQILPTTPAGEGNSPYSSYSAFAGNPLFIDLERLIEQGLLQKQECDVVDFGENEQRIDYNKVIAGKYALLKKAYKQFTPGEDYAAFQKRNRAWLPDYALYMSLKEQFDDAPWHQWAQDIRLREPTALNKWTETLAPEIGFWGFVQFTFYQQWFEMKAYANNKNVSIIGDIPIYAAMDSADVWANGELFLLDQCGQPTDVAGVPPDAFAATGQRWGNPLYNWDYMKQNQYAWWVERVRQTAAVCDITRIDHFRGFDEYYAIPAADQTAEFGKWRKGPGLELFTLINQALGHPKIIAEDLGVITKSVRALLKASGYPGMKILEFAFDSDWKNPYLPYNYTSDNTVVYTGTHDNDTVCGWYASCSSATRRFARKYLGIRKGEQPHWKFIRCAYSTCANLAVVQMQDFLGLGSEARMNVPSVENGCWSWRLGPGALPDALASRICRLTKEYNR